MFRNYLLIALRNLKRNKWFSLINIVGLSMGLATCMLIYLYTLDETSYDQFHTGKANIYRITSTITSPDGRVNSSGITGQVHGPAFAAKIPEIETYIRFQEQGSTIRYNGEIIDQSVCYVEKDFLKVFSFPLQIGDPAKALADPQSVVLTQSMAKRFFGKQDPIGKTIELRFDEEFIPFQVTAVAEDYPQNSTIKFDLLLPMQYLVKRYPDDQWINFFMNTFVVLQPGADVQKTVKKMMAVFQADAANQLSEARKKFDFKEKIEFGLQPLTDIHLSKEFRAANGLKDASDPIYSYILVAIASLILLIACINFINLTVGRSLKRAREIGIRKTVGGQQQQLIWQFLGESFLVCLFAFVLAIILANIALPFFNQMAGKQLAFSYLWSWKLLAGYVILLLATALLAGYYPALVLSRFNPVDTLYSRKPFTSKNYLGKLMVTFQFALATFLIIAVMAIYTQFNYLTRFDMGYKDKGIAFVNTPNIDVNKLTVFKSELLKNPAIEAVSADQGGDWFTLARINNGVSIDFNFKYIDENYFDFLQIPLLKGRSFSRHMGQDTVASVIVNESFVKKAGWKQPLGEEVDFFYNNKKYAVIGVIRDYHYASLNEPIQPQLFIFDPSYRYGNVYVKLKEGMMANAESHIAQTFKNIFPANPYAISYLDQENLQAYEKEARWKQIISASAVMTILISCIGLLGLSTIAAQQRTKEIGIRKVLGASVTGLIGNLSKDFLKLVIIAAIVAIPLAWLAVHKWLEQYPYRTSISWWMFGLAAALVVIIALFTTGIQAYQAALAKPVDSLKSE